MNAFSEFEKIAARLQEEEIPLKNAGQVFRQLSDLYEFHMELRRHYRIPIDGEPGGNQGETRKFPKSEIGLEAPPVRGQSVNVRNFGAPLDRK